VRAFVGAHAAPGEMWRGGIVTERLPVSDFGPLTSRPELVCTNSARDPDHAVLDVNIAPTKLADFANSQAAPRSEKRQALKPGRHRSHEHVEFCQAGWSNLAGSLDVGTTPDPGTGSSR
jgi:hypothetical protein